MIEWCSTLFLLFPAPTFPGSTALHWLAELARPDSDDVSYFMDNQVLILQQFIDSGRLDINTRAGPGLFSQTALHIACQSKIFVNLDFIKLLIDNGAVRVAYSLFVVVSLFLSNLSPSVCAWHRIRTSKMTRAALR